MSDHEDADWYRNEYGSAEEQRNAIGREMAQGQGIPLREAGTEHMNPIADMSRLIDSSYPADLDAEAHLWRRITKVGEEAGEVQTALRAYLGENPRKPVGSLEDLLDELLDTAGAALGAYCHLMADDGEDFDPLPALILRVERARNRLQVAIDQKGTP